jgi:hypothetical protein
MSVQLWRVYLSALLAISMLTGGNIVRGQHGYYPASTSSPPTFHAAQPTALAAYPSRYAGGRPVQHQPAKYQQAQYQRPQYQRAQHGPSPGSQRYPLPSRNPVAPAPAIFSPATNVSAPNYSRPLYAGQVNAGVTNHAMNHAMTHSMTHSMGRAQTSIASHASNCGCESCSQSGHIPSGNHVQYGSLMAGPMHTGPMHTGPMYNQGAMHGSTPEAQSSCQCATCVPGGFGEPLRSRSFASYSTDYGYGYQVDKVRDGFWYAGARSLLMTRDRADNVWLSLDDAALPTHLLDTRDASMGWKVGVEAYFGRVFGAGESAVEGRYWGIYSDIEQASVLQTAAVGTFDTPIDFTPLVYDNGTGAVAVGDFFQGAETHRIQRSFEVHNVEFNFLRLFSGSCDTCASPCGSCGWESCGDGGCRGGACGCETWAAAVVSSPLQVRWVAGVRYFRFDEGFQLATDRATIVFGDDPAEELFYEIDVANHLVGAQLGCRIDYATCRRWSFHGDSKLGIYGNHMTHRQFIGGANGAATIDDVGGPFNGGAYEFTTTRNDVSMLAELDFGIDVGISSCWSAGFGYRVVGATGVALTTSQVPLYFEHLGESRRLDASGSLLLHGGYAQIEYVR